MTRLSPCLDSIDTAARCRCGNCGTETRLDKLESIADAQLRITPGEETPAGECPECGALAYLVKAEPASPVPPATVYIVTREACELTDWETESEAFASEPDARAYARKAAHEFAKTEEVQEWLIPGGEPLEIVERPDGYRVDDGNNVNVMFQIHACPVAPSASEPNPLASMLSECVEALEFQIMGDSEEHSHSQRDLIERAKASLPASPDQNPATVSPDANRSQADFAGWVSVFAADTPGDYMDAATMLDTIQAAACDFAKSGTLPPGH